MKYQLERTYIGEDHTRREPRTVLDALEYDSKDQAQREAKDLNNKPFCPFFWRVVEVKPCAVKHDRKETVNT